MGTPKGRSIREWAGLAGLAALGVAAGAGVAISCGGGSPSPECRAASDCGAGRLCDGAGTCVACLLPADCPGSDTTCATRACAAGACGVSNASAGTPCGSGFACDGNGACAPTCSSPADCPGADTECRTRTCVAGACGATDAPAGTLLAAQVAGDCRRSQCDGSGAAVSAVDDADVPVDGNPCTQDLCAAGAPSNPFSSAHAPCPAGVCDGAGACVGCVDGADCASAVCTGQVCQAPTCADGVRNGAETGLDCGGPTCPPCPVGQGCAADADCTSGMCFAAQCRADLNGCTPALATDLTGSATTPVTFASFTYTPKCIKVKVGTVVTFSGSTAFDTFALHPLQGGAVIALAFVPAATGPFATVTSAGTSATFTMSAAGSFPYGCTVHAALYGMAGTIFVVP